MTSSSGALPVLEITNVQKRYAGLRPLRVRSLVLLQGERVAISGVDAAAAEVLVNLITGASLPEEGRICVFGSSTADIVDGDQWLASLDRFGIMTARAVLLAGATVEQNLAMPYTLDIDPVPPDLRTIVASLAEECGIAHASLQQPAGALPPAVLARIHFARAIALGPALLLLEHPTAMLAEPERRAFAIDVRRACETRAQTTVAFTQDQAFAAEVAHRVLTLQPATGTLVPLTRTRWFR